MSISFDGVAQTATLSSGTTTLSVPDLWSRWVDWLLTGDNSKYPLAMSQTGGDSIDAVAGTKIPAYIFLLNGWKVVPQQADHTLAVTSGILVVNGGGDPFTNPAGSYVIRINYQQPVQAITVSSGSGVTAQDKLDIATATLTAAQATPIYANTKQINDIGVVGSGTTSVPWGPAP